MSVPGGKWEQGAIGSLGVERMMGGLEGLA